MLLCKLHPVITVITSTEIALCHAGVGGDSVNTTHLSCTLYEVPQPELLLWHPPLLKPH